MADQNVFGDDGTWLGVMVEAEDGGAVLVNPDGYIVAAVNEDLTPADPNDYMFTEDEPEEVYEPVYEEPMANPYNQQAIAEEQWMNATLRELDRFERDTGQKLTAREAQAVMTELHRDFETGTKPDYVGAFMNAGLHDHSTHEGRTAAMGELLEDQAREDRGQEPADFRPARRAEVYDLDTHQGRADYAADRMAGYDDASERTVDDISLAARGEYAYDEDDL